MVLLIVIYVRSNKTILLSFPILNVEILSFNIVGFSLKSFPSTLETLNGSFKSIDKTSRVLL